MHFPCCGVLKTELDDEFNFEHCHYPLGGLHELIVGFQRRFGEVELMRLFI